MNKFSALFLLISIFLVTACARDLSSGSYSAFDIGDSAKTYEGVIKSKRKVKVKNEGGVGTLAGAGLGAASGASVGRGTGSVAAAIGGAVIGAVAGDMAEEGLSQREAFEYVVKLDGGKLKTVVQGQDEIFDVGQKVYLIESAGKHGRARLAAR